uniref:Ubiquitin-like domain-containing protein n=2 Tax=Clytia hemisphaerica TaxID=252671 RepID=A0A7M5X2J7_9CNID
MVWNKSNYEMTKLGKSNTVADLREYIAELTGIPTNMQKIMFKGLVKDDAKTLEEIKLTSGSKVMVVGSTVKDIEKVKTPTTQELKAQAQSEAAASKEALCKQKQHKKVLDKGKPDDVPVGVKGRKEPLPQVPLSGMVNKTGGRVRLTFKLELDQLWLGTKERTEKLPMSSIRNVVSEPIEGQEEYHILAIQLGPTEASRYWIYWFPAQYVDSVKDTILGKWQVF